MMVKRNSCSNIFACLSFTISCLKFQSEPKQWTSSEHSTACFLNNATFQNVVVKKFTFTVTLITSLGRSNSKGKIVFKE
jgi:hypothetical protein